HGGSSSRVTIGSVPITQWIGCAPRQDKKSGQSPGQIDGQPAGRSDLGGRSCPRAPPEPLINSAGSGTWGNRRHFRANNRVSLLPPTGRGPATRLSLVLETCRCVPARLLLFFSPSSERCCPRERTRPNPASRRLSFGSSRWTE